MIITISGKPGAGKTKAAENLSKKLGYEFISAGDLHGMIAEDEGISIGELMEKAKTDLSIHTKMDKKTTEIGKNKNDFVMEGWIAYNFIPQSYKLFLNVDSNVGARRIMDAERPDEKYTGDIWEVKQAIEKRVQDSNEGFKKSYGINFLEQENYDTIIDTSNKTPKQVLELIEIKAKDHQQLMNPINFYLAHPTKSRKDVREWELEFEKRTKINLINPFHDCNTLETEMGNMNEEKYEILGENSGELFRGDLENLADKTTIGGIFIFDKNYSIGTSEEKGINKLMGKLTYSVVTNPIYRNHSSIKLMSDKIFPNKAELEKFLTQNKNNLYGLLERSRKKTTKDKTFLKIFDQIEKNFQYQN